MTLHTSIGTVLLASASNYMNVKCYVTEMTKFCIRASLANAFLRQRLINCILAGQLLKI